MRKIIASVDIGSNTIKIVVAEIVKNRPHVLGSVNHKSDGVVEGLVSNENKFALSLKEAFDKINDLIGQQINKVIINVPSNDAEYGLSDGTVMITNDEHLITGSDVTKVISESVKDRIPQNVELISVTPIEFIIDNKNKVKDPKGLTGEISDV